MSEGKRRLAAIMFTDMVGYTALGQRDESLSLALVDEQRKLIRPILARHDGREVKTMGDAFMVEFPNALDAVRCAYDIQRATREFNISVPTEKKIHLRVGLHLGDVVESQGDISGDAVNVASRIEPLAEDGGVCLTRQVYDHVSGKFELQMTSLGLKPLKNVSVPVEVFKVAMPWERSTTEAPTFPTNRIAILPFASFSLDPNDGFFADGMTDEIISTVSGISGLSVISRTSVTGYKGTTKKVEEIGRELKVGSILEGSFKKAGSRIRVTTQLIDVAGDRHLWAQNYDRDFEDVFAVQSDIAKQVADALRIRMLPQEAQRIEKRPTKSTEAYGLYLKGRYYWNERNKESLLKAIEYFKQAIQMDPEFALAYSGMADCYSVLGDHLYVPYLEAFTKSKENALKAVQYDDSSAEAHTSLANVLTADYDWKGGEKEYKKALELNPNYATSHHWYGILLASTGRFDESLGEAARAQLLDPLSLQLTIFRGTVYKGMKKYDLAEEQFRKVLEDDPNFVPAHGNLYWTYFLQGKYDEAEKEAEQYLRLRNNDTSARVWFAVIYAWTGKGDEARKIVDELRARSDVYVPNQALILVHLGLGEKERAIELIQRDFEGHAGWLPDLAVEQTYSSVRSDPRVVEILKKIGLEALTSDRQ